MPPGSEDRVDYDRIASHYDRRFVSQPSSAIADALRELMRQVDARRVFEVGCGTGRWLATLDSIAGEVVGLDSSIGMLYQAHAKRTASALLQGDSAELPFVDGSFDVVFCVNAIHHFGRPERFIQEAAQLVRAVVGRDPRGGSAMRCGHELLARPFAAPRARSRRRTIDRWRRLQSRRTLVRSGRQSVHRRTRQAARWLAPTAVDTRILSPVTLRS